MCSSVPAHLLPNTGKCPGCTFAIYHPVNSVPRFSSLSISTARRPKEHFLGTRAKHTTLPGGTWPRPARYDRVNLKACISYQRTLFPLLPGTNNHYTQIKLDKFNHNPNIYGRGYYTSPVIIKHNLPAASAGDEYTLTS